MRIQQQLFQYLHAFEKNRKGMGLFDAVAACRAEVPGFPSACWIGLIRRLLLRPDAGSPVKRRSKSLGQYDLSLDGERAPRRRMSQNAEELGFRECGVASMRRRGRSSSVNGRKGREEEE